MNQVPGIIYIIAAASGTGKTSLAKALAESMPQIKISVSHTTRPVRNGESHMHHYFFVETSTFEKMISNHEFLEHANVFGDYYGTSKAWVIEQLQQGNDVLLDIDWQGAQQIRKQLPCVSVFLLPPSRVALRHRLEKRRRETPEIIQSRLDKASSEILHYAEFDYIVINDKFEVALEDLQAIVRAQRLSLKQQAVRYRQLLVDLMAK